MIVMLVGCSKQEYSSPLVFSGQGEDWKAEMVIQQENFEGASGYRARYKYNITYKDGESEKYINKWMDDEEVHLRFFIEEVHKDIEDSDQHKMFYGYQDYWLYGITNNSYEDPYRKDDEFEVILEFDGRKERFNMNFNRAKTHKLDTFEGDVIEDYLQGPIGVEYERFFKGAMIK